MLAIVSDLHITDETTANNMDRSATKLLGDEIVAAAKRVKAKEIKLVLLGDIFDLVRTDYWHRNDIPMAERPWGGTLDKKTGMNTHPGVQRQFREILRGPTGTTGVLGSKAAGGLIKMAQSLGGRTGVPVEVTYVIGNHDRVFNNFTALQQDLAGAFRPVRVVFDNKVASRDYKLLARHGHEWDEHCHGWEFARKVLKDKTVKRFDKRVYKVMAIGEVVTAELMSGLVHRVLNDPEFDSTNKDDAAFGSLLKDVNNVRPMTDVFRWVTWFTRGRPNRYFKIVERCLLESLDALLECSLAKRWDKLKRDFLVRGDLTDRLTLARDLLVDRGLKDLGRTAEFVAKLPLGGGDDYQEGAEREFKNLSTNGVRHVVYGHTHRALNHCFSVSDKGAHNMYINTGTYLPLIEAAGDGGSFSQLYRMTMVFFFRQDEDVEDRDTAQPTFDVWNGVRRKVYA